MFSEVELHRNVAILVKNPSTNRIISRSCIVTRLLEDLSREKATKDHGYLLSVTELKSIGKGEFIDELGQVLFPVAFICRSFLPLRGEILQGHVHHTCRLGVFLRCGPIRIIFLSARKMPDFRYVYGETSRGPYFMNDKLGKIETGVVVRFMVLDVRWIEMRNNDIRREFVMLASLEGDSIMLGPVTESDPDEVHF